MIGDHTGSSGDEGTTGRANAIEAAVHVSARDEPVATRHLSRPYEAVLADGSVGPERALERIYIGAVLDRLAPALAVQLLQLCRKALKPGGRLRLATEDLESLLAKPGTEAGSPRTDLNGRRADSMS
jgi:hypothetical protein